MEYTTIVSEKLEIKQMAGSCLLVPGSILRVEASNNYSIIHFTDKRPVVVVSKVLSWVQQQLPEDMFVRVHRSHLVNRWFIQQVSGNASKIIKLTNGECVPVSRRKRAVV